MYITHRESFRSFFIRTVGYKRHSLNKSGVDSWLLSFCFTDSFVYSIKLFRSHFAFGRWSAAPILQRFVASLLVFSDPTVYLIVGYVENHTREQIIFALFEAIVNYFLSLFKSCSSSVFHITPCLILICLLMYHRLRVYIL